MIHLADFFFFFSLNTKKSFCCLLLVKHCFFISRSGFCHPDNEKGDQENLNLELILLSRFTEISFVMTFESVSDAA